MAGAGPGIFLASPPESAACDHARSRGEGTGPRSRLRRLGCNIVEPAPPSGFWAAGGRSARASGMAPVWRGPGAQRTPFETLASSCWRSGCRARVGRRIRATRHTPRRQRACSAGLRVFGPPARSSLSRRGACGRRRATPQAGGAEEAALRPSAARPPRGRTLRRGLALVPEPRALGWPCAGDLHAQSVIGFPRTADSSPRPRAPFALCSAVPRNFALRVCAATSARVCQQCRGTEGRRGPRAHSCTLCATPTPLHPPVPPRKPRLRAWK